MPTGLLDVDRERIIDELHRRWQTDRDTRSRQAGTSRPFDSDADEQRWAYQQIAGYLEEVNRTRIDQGLDVLAETDEQQIGTAVYDRAYGLGRLDQMLRDPTIADIHVFRYDHAMVRRKDGKWARFQHPVARSNDELIRIVQNAAARHGTIERRWDQLNPELNMQLKDGSRLFAVRDVIDNPRVVIRKHDDSLASLADLIPTGYLTPQTAHFLEKMVRARLNTVIVGATSSGKTTLLRSLCACMPPDEHKVTIEEAKELGLERDVRRHPLVTALETRGADMQGNGEVNAQRLVRMSLRMDPDRIILGEVRGGEALQMLTAMTQGQSGSLCTMHGESAKIAYPRLALYVKFGDIPISDEDVARLIVDAVHFVIYVAKVPTGDGRTYRRVIDHIIETRGVNGSQVTSNMLMNRDNPDGILKPVSKPSERTMPKLLDVGFDFNYWASDPTRGRG